MKSAIDLYRESRSKPKGRKKSSSLVQRASFKDAIEFAGGNPIVQKMYEAYRKKNKQPP